MKILLTGGGSGGHIMPLLAVVDELRKSKNEMGIQDLKLMFIGSDSDFNKSIFNAGILVKKIKAGKLRRYFSFKNLIDTLKIPIGIIQSLYYVYKFKPDVIFSKGGFASVPPVLASWILKVPIITHESDIIPGLANRIISKFASKILLSFSDSEKYFDKNKMILTGNPVRFDIIKGNRENALAFFKLSSAFPTILIFGGSQGAQKINEIILESIPKILEKYQVIHICGNKNYKDLENKIKTLDLKNISRYKTYPFLTEKLKDAYTLADIVISRAGANSLSEIINLEKPSIIIPLPTSANNHQFQNAEFFDKKGMIAMVEEKDLTANCLMEKLSKILQEDDFKDSMIRKMKQYNNSAKQNPALNVAKEIIRFNKK